MKTDKNKMKTTKAKTNLIQVNTRVGRKIISKREKPTQKQRK